MSGHTLPELTDFFSQCQWPGEPVTLRDGLIVSDYKEFVRLHIKKVKEDQALISKENKTNKEWIRAKEVARYAKEYLWRLQELRIRILYCKKINEIAWVT